MKLKMFAMLFSSLLMVSLAFGQDGKRGAKLADNLGLSAEQKPQVQAILKEQREAMQTARQNKASKQELKAIHQKTHERLAGVLDSSQMEKFDNASKKTKRGRKPKA
jgi:hypothetical protein